ncbi:ROK family protein [Paenibacillus cymbidii]|uniref:ROK family protein n=1 Tax=Paenibacillus cymbidii TaxID=1639034 RepID=UPI001080846B|nr:ROK family protein [Paenibacillus cymbidii]
MKRLPAIIDISAPVATAVEPMHNFRRISRKPRTRPRGLRSSGTRSGIPVLGIGASIPGVIESRQGVLINAAHMERWQAVPIGAYLGEKRRMPVWADNESRNMAVAEKWFGCGKESNHFVTIQTKEGIGTGIIVNGSIYPGKDNRLRAQVREYARMLAIGIVNIVNALNPKMIVLHGDIRHLGQPFLDTVTAIVRKRALVPSNHRVTFRFSSFVEDSKIIGAASLALKEIVGGALLGGADGKAGGGGASNTTITSSSATIISKMRRPSPGPTGSAKWQAKTTGGKRGWHMRRPS